MADDKPVIYILHGDDPVEIGKFVEVMAARLAETGMADLNLSRLDARSCNESDLRTAAMAMPFLVDRRLVILDQAQARLGKPKDESFKPFLQDVPDSTALVLIVDDEFLTTGKKKGWQSLSAEHWLWKWLEEAGGRSFYRACKQPAQKEMAGWIRKTAEAQGGKFTPGAAIALADHTGNDTQYAAQEITKLLLYVDSARPIEPEDVELLTAPGGQVSVFDMVDSLAEGSSNRAMHLLHDLLDETDPPSLFGMIVRQFRLLIQAREVLDAGGSADAISREIGIQPYVAGKLATQAGRFTFAQLRMIYHRLLALDEGTKTSLWPPDLALEMFIAELKT
jgi:DNA polymerase III subunit delta